MRKIELIAERWNALGHEAAVRALRRTGHATGLAGQQWNQLPGKVRRDLGRFFAAFITARDVKRANPNVRVVTKMVNIKPKGR